MDKTKIIESVQQQYEELPYPPRNPDDEKNRLLQTYGDSLCELNHHCFNGKKDFSQGFRCLVAGGGTGDSAIYLADQLRETDAQVYYLDMSASSRAIAEERAKVRGLRNITWITASLLDLPQLDIGEFDYINCSGVLHHLGNPEEGLGALKTVLKDDGAMYIMLYAEHGRHAVYVMQSLLRKLIPGNLPISVKVSLARRILAGLPAEHDFNQKLSLWKSELESDGYGDSGLYDLLLHSVDRCYNVDQVYELAASAGMHVVDFLGKDRRFYDPDNLANDPSIKQLWTDASIRQRQAIAEELYCSHKKHCFYLSTSTTSKATLEDESNSISLTRELAGQHLALSNTLQPGETLTITMNREGRKDEFKIMGNPINKSCFKYFDGKTPIRKIIKKTRIGTKGTTDLKIKKELESIFALFEPLEWICLQQKSL